MTLLLSAWAFLKKLPGWLYAALGIALAFLAAYLRGKSQGASGERQKANEEALERKAETDKIEREIESLPEDELRKRGEPWVRR